MAKQVFDLREGKGMSAGQSTEHLRNYNITDPDMKKYGYYDPTRVKLNFEVGKGGVVMPVNKQYSIVQRFKDNLRNRGIEDPNEIKRKKGLEPNRNTVANIILGGSREQMHKLAYGDQKVDIVKGADNRQIIRHPDIEKWAVDMYNFISKRFGEENIIAFVVHLDEKNPHVHCTVVPVNEKNKISYQDYFGHNKEEARRTFLNLHNEVAEVNKKYDLERGEDINTTGARHRTSEEYWNWLRDKCNELENQKQGKEDALKFVDEEYRRTEIKMKGLSKMLSNLEVRKTDLLNEIYELEEESQSGQNSVSELQKKINILQTQVEEIEKKMKDKKEKLESAREQLEILADKYAEFTRENDELVRSINREKDTLNRLGVSRNVQEAQAQGWRESVIIAQSIKENLENYEYENETEEYYFSKFKKEFFDESIFQDMAERGTEIIAVTTALYMGSVEQAMNFAESRGGGGGPGSGWGRKPGEDDDSFRGRCFGMARLMMRPRERQQQQSRGFRR